MDRPQVDRIEGIPPAIAINQTNPVRTSRSTVGTMTELVEHDPEVMLAADRIVDLGPEPGETGGQVVAQGTPQALIADENSITGAYLAGRRQVAIEWNEHAGPPDLCT